MYDLSEAIGMNINALSWLAPPCTTCKEKIQDMIDPGFIMIDTGVAKCWQIKGLAMEKWATSGSKSWLGHGQFWQG